MDALNTGMENLNLLLGGTERRFSAYQCPAYAGFQLRGKRALGGRYCDSASATAIAVFLWQRAISA
jgi:hypothetical protein